MIKKDLIIKNQLGLHARVSNKLATLSSKFKSNVEIIFNDEKVDAKNMMDILLLSIGLHDTFTLQIEGIDEKKAFDSIAKLVDNFFGEGK